MTSGSGIVWVLTALFALGCSSADTPASHTAAASAAAAAASPGASQGEGPCRLLTTDEVQRAFPNSKPGVLNRDQEKHGVLSCIWDHPTGRFSIVAGTDEKETQSAREEAKGWTLLFLDPLNPAAERHVRYEVLSGVGDDAVAIVEAADKSKGFTTYAALVVVRRGSRQVTAMSTELARRDRAEALGVLTTIGRAIAGRLE
jgi:hypothetical protein